MHGTDFDLTEKIKKASERTEQLKREHIQIQPNHSIIIERKLDKLIEQNDKIIKLLKKVVKQNA